MDNLLDYSVIEKLNLARTPVGIKLVAIKPEGIDRTDHPITFCQCVREAQEKGPFYAGEKDFPCVEPMLLGMQEFEPAYISGLVGGISGLFKEPRANRHLYQFLPRMLKGSVKYVVFSPIDQLTFDPDVTIFVADVGQAQTLIRAVGYATGESWSAKGTPVIACSWLYIYPILSGEMNFTVTGLSLGMQSLNVFPPGLFLIAVPWNKMAELLTNLKDDRLFRKMIPSTREEHFKNVNAMLEKLNHKISE